MLSFIIPAHNEERWIGQCLGSIHTTMEKVAEPYEVVVVDDASTDSTPEIARRRGARVLHVDFRKISAVRNEGARAARGELFLFVDADTQINKEALGAGLEILRSGAAGGGSVFEFEESIPVWARLVHRFGVIMGWILSLTGGCFLYCTREAFQTAGGFSEGLRAGEDMAFVQALKKVGRFVVAKPTVVTSARKLRVVGFWEVIVLLVAITLRGARYESEKTLDFIYGQRAQECRKPPTRG